jgi:hypothetical protein
MAIEYRRIGRLPTCVGNERLRIETDGRVSHARNTAECEPGVQWSAPWQAVGTLDAPALARLEQQIVETGLLRLPAQSIDDAAEGGKREEIDLVLDGRSHHVVVENVDPPPFRAAVRLLWGVLAELSR